MRVWLSLSAMVAILSTNNSVTFYEWSASVFMRMGRLSGERARYLYGWRVIKKGRSISVNKFMAHYFWGNL